MAMKYKYLIILLSVALLATLLVLHVHPILSPFIWALILSYLLSPLVTKLSARGMGRIVATSLVVLPFFIVLYGSFFALIPYIKVQLMSFIERVPAYYATITLFIQDQIHHFPFLSNALSGDFSNGAHPLNLPKIIDFMGSLAGDILHNSLSVLDAIITLSLIPLLVFYMVKDWTKYLPSFLRLIPNHYQGEAKKIMHEADEKVGTFLRAQLSVSIIFAIYYATALSLLGLNHGLILGLLTGLFSFIPVITVVVSAIICFAIALFQFDSGMSFVWLALILGTGQALENSFFIPKYVGNKVGLSATMILFVLLAGGYLMGVLGMIISIPLAAFFRVLWQHFIMRYQQSDFYKQ